MQHQEDTLNELNRKVAETYRAIFSEGDATLSTLQMLTNIEAKLEELLSTIDSMPKDEVEAEEKKKEKERRQRARDQAGGGGGGAGGADPALDPPRAAAGGEADGEARHVPSQPPQRKVVDEGVVKVNAEGSTTGYSKAR